MGYYYEEDEEFEAKKEELFEKVEEEIIFDKDFSEFVWEIFEDMQELTIDEFTRELDWKLRNEDNPNNWVLIREYSCIESPITLDEAKKCLLHDISKFFENK